MTLDDLFPNAGTWADVLDWHEMDSFVSEYAMTSGQIIEKYATATIVNNMLGVKIIEFADGSSVALDPMNSAWSSYYQPLLAIRHAVTKEKIA